jgi:hypothetical protein
VAGFEAPTGPPRSPTSAASPWLAWLVEQRERGLTAKRIHQDLLVEHPAAAAVSYDSVRRLLKKHGATAPVPFRRMESPPGFEAQLDFGTGAPVIGPDGRRHKTHVLRVVLSHSRRGSRVAHQPEDRCGGAIGRATLILQRAAGNTVAPGRSTFPSRPRDSGNRF